MIQYSTQREKPADVVISLQLTQPHGPEKGATNATLWNLLDKFLPFELPRTL